MKPKIYIDGSEGTTGLRINERFEKRDDIEVIRISSELRKDPKERARLINESDITFLCLPDAASIEAVSFIENDNVRIIDASTAHRTLPDWAYGFPELSSDFRARIKTGKRVAVPGCHASGFMSLAYPLIKEGIVSKDEKLVSFSLTGYSGGGKKMIAQYESEDKTADLFAPREYGITQMHKHLKEMQAIPGLTYAPSFTPIVDDYYSGMITNIPLFCDSIGKSRKEIHEFFTEYYKGEKFINVMPLDAQTEDLSGFMAGNTMSGRDSMNIYICGNDERILIASQFDNLGKGASGAAIQCMNIMLGFEEDRGLNL